MEDYGNLDEINIRDNKKFLEVIKQMVSTKIKSYVKNLHLREKDDKESAKVLNFFLNIIKILDNSM